MDLPWMSSVGAISISTSPSILLCSKSAINVLMNRAPRMHSQAAFDTPDGEELSILVLGFHPGGRLVQHLFRALHVH